MDYIESAMAEAAAAAPATPEVEATPAAPETEQVEATQTEETTTEETAEQSTEPNEVEQLKIQNKKIINANSRKEKIITKLGGKLDQANRTIAELQQKLVAPAPREEDFEGKPYSEFLTATTRHELKTGKAEEAIAELTNEATQIETELRNASQAVLEESSERAEKTFPDVRQVMESHATWDRGDGQKVIPLSPAATDIFNRSDDPVAALYAILKDGALNVLNSLPPIEAAMMIKEYEIKAQSLPKIKHVSSAPEPITSARGVASGSKSIDNFSPEEKLSYFKS